MDAPTTSDLPSLSIRRPWLVTVFNLLIVIAGAAALLGIEIRELPNVDRPIVTVRATYPGASPQTMDSEVTRIVEAATARVSGVLSVRSASEEGTMRITVEFGPNVDLITAANDVREAVSRVEQDLPEDVEDLTVVRADDDASPVMRLAVTSDTLPIDELTRKIEDEIQPELISVEGVADVTLFGNQQRVMRVRIDPARLAAYEVSVDDVADAMRSARADVPAGSFESLQQEVLVRADASVVDPRQVEDIRLRDNVRLGDVAQVSYTPADATSYVRLDNRTVINLGVLRQAQSNSVAISDGVQRLVARINEREPDLEVTVVSNDAIFIEGAIREVLISLALAVLIVVAVVWLFIGQWRATLIPVLAIPIALIGTLAAIWVFGFSLNLLTLLALVLATGLVVDDSIVVLENIQRRQSEGMGARAAAVLGTREVFFAVVATTATLIAVFLPISFLPSTAGRLFAEFGFVMAFTVAISSFVALSLGPMVASRLSFERQPGRLQRGMASFGNRLSGRYDQAVSRALDQRWWVLLGSVLLAGAAAWTYGQLDEELVPPEDRGVLLMDLRAPEGVGLAYTDRQIEQAQALLQPLVDDGTVQRIFTITGRFDPNRGFLVAPLSDWADRDVGQAELTARLNRELQSLPGAQVRMISGNSLGLRNADGSVRLAITGNDYTAIADAAERFAAAIERDLPQLRDVRVSYQAAQPELSLNIDRRRAEELGVPVASLDLVLRALVDGNEVTELSVDDRTVPVILESAGGTVNSVQDLLMLTARGTGDRPIPLSQFVSFEERGAASELNRNGQRRAVEVDMALGDGATLREAVDGLRALAGKELPEGMGLLFLGEAQTLEETSRGIAVTFLIALVVVFLVLVAQFESVTSAAVVMVTVPFGLCAASLAMFLTGTSLNIYSQIGLLLLVGVMAKNSILMVEFADQLRDAGRSVLDAAREAASTRLRPIAMTMASTVLGAVPLIIGSGPGAESRAAIGWVIFGGLSLAAVFTLFLTPVVYALLAQFAKPRKHQGEQLARELQAVDEPQGDAA